LFDAINATTLIGLRDRGLIGLIVYRFPWMGAALGMMSRTYSNSTVAYREKWGKAHAMPVATS
jgi:hypothetical protein